MSITMEEAAVKEPKRMSPHIAAFKRDNAKQYFIFMEEDVFCEVPNLTAALMWWLRGYQEKPILLNVFYVHTII